MKSFFCFCSIIAILSISFLYADEADDFFGGNETPSTRSTNSTPPPASKPSTPKKKHKNKNKNKAHNQAPAKVAEQEQFDTPARAEGSESVVYDKLKDIPLNSGEAYQRLLGLRNTNPTSIEPDYTMALLFVFTQKNFQSATKHFQQCKIIRPEDTKVLINLGTVYILDGKYTEAFACYNKAFQLGAKSYVMSHNLNKFVTLMQCKVIKLPEAVKKKYATFAQEVFKQTPPPKFNSQKGWLFEPCSDGSSKEQFKRKWFKYPNYSCYEFPICIACKGTGKVDCPNRSCSAGKVGVMVTKTYATPNKERVKMQVRQKVNCDVCNGSSHVACPLCKGIGLEYTPEDSEGRFGN